MKQSPIFQTAGIEGPLDLILTLISKHKLNIADIEIAVLLDQYMDFVRQMQDEDMEIASEFLQMASHLVYIKTVSLLPRHEEETKRLKQELSDRLLLYEACKTAAAFLQQQQKLPPRFVREMAPIEFDPTFTGHVHLHVLLGAYISMTGKAARRLPPKQEVFHDYVQKPIVSVNEKLEDILTSLKTGGHLHYRRLFSAQPTKSSAIAAFLALLELIRDHRVHMDDEGEITLITEDNP